MCPRPRQGAQSPASGTALAQSCAQRPTWPSLVCCPAGRGGCRGESLLCLSLSCRCSCGVPTMQVPSRAPLPSMQGSESWCCPMVKGPSPQRRRLWPGSYPLWPPLGHLKVTTPRTGPHGDQAVRSVQHVGRPRTLSPGVHCPASGGATMPAWSPHASCGQKTHGPETHPQGPSCQLATPRG